MTIEVENHGNGDDTISIIPTLEESCVDAGWQVTPPISNLTVAAGNDRSQSFTVFSAINSTESDCEVTFEASSESPDLEVLSTSTDVVISLVSLEILKSSIEPDDADAEANTGGFFKIPIKNNGFLDATGVKITLEADSEGDTEYAEKSDYIDIPANGTAYANFSYDDLPPGPARFKITIDPVNNPVDSDSDSSEVFTRTFSNMADSDDESPLFTVVIVVLALLVLFGGYKTARKGSSGRF